MKRLEQFFIGGRRFKQEFRRQIRLLIVVTIGFTVAFSWRQTIFDAVQTLVQALFGKEGLSSSILTSIFITLFGLILIYLASQILKERSEDD